MSMNPNLWAVSPFECIIDSRDVINRIEELENMRDDDEAEVGLDEDEVEELDALTDLAAVASNCADDWEYGEELISESYFVEYAQELAASITHDREDITSSWPYNHIDWDEAAEELKQDYSEVEFDRQTYYIR